MKDNQNFAHYTNRSSNTHCCCRKKEVITCRWNSWSLLFVVVVVHFLAAGILRTVVYLWCSLCQ